MMVIYKTYPLILPYLIISCLVIQGRQYIFKIALK